MGRAFPGGGSAVVAREAATRELCVIDSDDGFPCRRGMAGFAAIRRDYVRGALTSRARSIVAADAIGGNARVTERRRGPSHGRVAAAAVRRRQDVICGLPGGSSAVMA